MKMKKWTFLAAALMGVFLVLTGCSGKAAPSPTPSASEEPTATYTGILQEKKDFMIVVGEEGEEGEADVSYTFNLDNTKVDAKVGDKVTVTYTGDLSDIDSTLTATKVEAAS